jgi:hypothetical protein
MVANKTSKPAKGMIRVCPWPSAAKNYSQQMVEGGFVETS